MKKALLVLLGLFLISAVLNQPSSHSSAFSNHIELTGRLSVLKASEMLRTIDDITAADISEDFLAIDNNYVNLGKSNELWLRVDLSDLTITSLQGYIFEIERNAIIRPAEIYYPTRVTTWQQNPLLNKSQYLNRLLTTINEDTMPQVIYLRLTGKYLRATINLYSADGFLQHLQSFALYNGLYYGMLLLFILFNLVLYSRLKVNAYWAYSALLSSILLLFASGQGWLVFLYPESVLPNTLPPAIFAMLMALASAEFAKQYLQIKTFSIKFHGVLSTLQIVVFSLLVGKIVLGNYLPQTQYFIAYGVGLLAILAIFVSCILAAIMSLQLKKQEAWYYLSATFVFFSTAICMALSAGDLINVKFSWAFLQAASVIEFLIFSAGLLAIYQRQLSEKEGTELALQTTQAELVKQLEFSNSLKDNILTTVVDPKLFTELAKITKKLTDIRYVQSSGNDCLVVYKEKNQRRETELECNLQNLADSFGDKHFLRVHKSYLINPQHNYVLKRRTSADYDLLLLGEVIPVGRKYLSQVKSKLQA